MKQFAPLEPLLQVLRIQRVLGHIPKGKVIVDIGCDDPPVFLNKIKGFSKKCVGIDIVVHPHAYENVQILQQDLQRKIELPSNSTDVITMMAVLEHMKHPEEIMFECYRVLKKGGVLLITVPSPMNKPLLELLSAFSLVRREMIHQHENYFTKNRLRNMAKGCGFRAVDVQMFELGFNTFCRAVK